MITIEQIYAAHSNVKSGADFPNFIKEIKSLGVTHYEAYVFDGHVDYYDTNNNIIQSDAKYRTIVIQNEVTESAFKEGLLDHQKGLTDYPTFIQMCADCGIVKWKVDINKMTCTYYAQLDEMILEENIPSI